MRICMYDLCVICDRVDRWVARIWILVVFGCLESIFPRDWPELPFGGFVDGGFVYFFIGRNIFLHLFIVGDLTFV